MKQIKFFNKEDKERVIEFNRLVHNEEIDSTVNNIMFKNPYNNLENFAYIEEDRNILSMVGLLQHKQRFGINEINVGEITLVGTHPNYRKRGLCTTLINYWTNYMKKNKIHLCFLFGIANFYQQFGFEYAVPGHFYPYVTINKELLKNIEGCCLIEELNLKEILVLKQENIIKQINSIYNECSKDNFCSDIRNTEYFKYRIENTSFGIHKWYIIRNSKRLLGYFWITETEKKFVVNEANILDEEAEKGFCHFIYEYTKNNDKISEIELKAPLNNSFSRFFYKIGGSFHCNNEIYPGSWAGMYKIIDLKLALMTLKEIFEKRLKESKFYNFVGSYRIISDIGNVIIFINNSKVTIKEELEFQEKTDDIEKIIDIKFPMNILTSIYTGYRALDYYKDDLNFNKDDDFQLFNILFPTGFPYIWDLEMSDGL